MTKDYEKFLPYINNNHDFSELLSELLGELNVCHTGGRFYPEERGDETAETGLLFEWNERRPGLIVTEILEKGPFDNARSKVRPETFWKRLTDKKSKSGWTIFLC